MRRIDADALIEYCQRMISDNWNSGAAPVSWSQAYADFIDDIENAPTIEPPARRSGKWLETVSADGEKVYKCSICGAKCYEPHEECPNCWNAMEKIERYTPTVGRWEEVNCGIYVATEYTCSLCGQSVLHAGNEVDNCGYVRCPHCGKRMEVKHD